MKIRTYMAIIFLLISFMASCATQKDSRSLSGDKNTLDTAGAGEIMKWVDQDLAPYIEEQFQRHPWLKNKSFSVGAMQDEEILPKIDRLSEEIRLQLVQHLRSAQGVQMAWRPIQEPLKHHRNMDELTENIDCVDMDPIEIFVGIEIRRLITGEIQINVNAVDKKEERWVPNFGHSWEGQVNDKLLKALDSKDVDERLRGLRPLPFESDEPDLLASYLATNLSCLFKRGVDNHDELSIYVDQKQGVTDLRVISRAFEMLDSYLNKMNRVRITNREDKADVVMKRNVVDIDEEMVVLWVKNTYQDGSRVQGVETEVYVQTEKKSSL